MPDAGGSARRQSTRPSSPRPGPCRGRGRRVLVTGRPGCSARTSLRPRGRRATRSSRGRRSDLDIDDAAPGLARACGSFGPHVVVNCAAFTKVDDVRDRSPRVRGQRRGASLILADACGHVGAQLVQISTDFVFDGAKGAPYREDDPVGPLSAYGRSKRAGEEEALRLPGSLVVRASWLFGRSRLELRRGDPEAGRGRASRGSRSSIDQVGRPDGDDGPLRGDPGAARGGRLRRVPLRQPGRGLVERVRPRDPRGSPGATDVPVDPTTSEALAPPGARGRPTRCSTRASTSG